jgi:hypothetical protein
MPDATSRPFEGLRVLAMSPTPTHPAIAGNRVRLGALLDRLQDGGATVRLIHIAHEPGDLPAMQAHWSSGGAVSVPFQMPPTRHARFNRFAERCRRLLHLPVADRVDVDDWFDPGTRAGVIAEASEFRPHAVLMVYIWHSALLSTLPAGVLRVLDAQDVFADRNARMARAGVAQQWYSVTAAEEARGLARFDVVLAIQEHEAAHYRALAPRDVVTVGHMLPIIDAGAPSESPRLLIVASDNAVNVDGVRWFLDRIWPAVKARRAEATLDIVGRVCTALSPRDGVSLRGPIDDLQAAYASSRLVVNPLRGGTGLKIKGAEALAAGRVVISTPSAAEGLESATGRGLVVADGETAMVDAIVALLGDDVTVARLSLAATEFAREWNAVHGDAFDAVFARALPTMG